MCLNNVDDPRRGESLFTDIISWLPCEVAKCAIFLLKINTGYPGHCAQSQLSNPPLRELRERTTVHGGSERGGHRQDLSSLGTSQHKD